MLPLRILLALVGLLGSRGKCISSSSGSGLFGLVLFHEIAEHLISLETFSFSCAFLDTWTQP